MKSRMPAAVVALCGTMMLFGGQQAFAQDTSTHTHDLRLFADCGDSFANDYVGYRTGDDFEVKITYVDVRRWNSSFADYVTSTGHSSENYNVNPNGGNHVVSDLQQREQGPWRVYLYQAGGAPACSKGFSVALLG